LAGDLSFCEFEALCVVVLNVYPSISESRATVKPVLVVIALTLSEFSLSGFPLEAACVGCGW
jgi:hypothetical protein